jgi:hypothetical protein
MRRPAPDLIARGRPAVSAVVADCQVEVDGLEQVIMIYREEERVFLPEPLVDRLQSALEQAYREQSAPHSEPDKPTE